MSLIAALSLLLIGAHLLGRLAEQLRQPALLGHMLAGILLGPSVLQWIHNSSALNAVADISVLFVVVTAGLEMRMQHVIESFRGKGTIALALGFFIPAAGAAALAYALGLTLVPGLVTILCVSVTALPVALRILSDFGLLKTRIAQVAISGALLSDVIVLLVLGIVMTSSTSPPGTWQLGATLFLSIAKLGLLLAIVGACHILCLRLSARQKTEHAERTQPSVDTVLVLTMVFMFSLGAVSELLGFHFAIGVFLAALMVTRDLISDARFESLERTCELMTVSLFGPLFLAYQGIQFEMDALKNFALVGGLIVVAVVTKFLGGYAAARWKQLPSHEAWGVAVIMNARGVMEMVVASIAYRAGLVDRELFSALLVMGIVTTVMTPIMLRRWVARQAALTERL